MENRFLAEVLGRLQSEGSLLKGEALAKHQAYINCKMKFYGLSVPVQRALSKKPYSFSDPDFSKELKVWNEIWHLTDVFEVRSQAMHALEKHRKKDFIIDAWPVLREWPKTLNNWAHSDGLSDIFARCLELDKKRIYPELVKWNRSTNPWYRRQSLVSLFYYASMRKKLLPVSEVFPLIERLIKDDDYYVQKGVGWSLREAGNVYPKETLRFLREHIGDLRSYAFSAATEKLSVQDKQKLKALRSKRAAR